MTRKKANIAIVYDRINTTFGGAEVVLKAIHELFPSAKMYTSVYHKKKASWANNISVVPSFLQKIPFFRNKHQFLLPFMPLAFESLDLSNYDLIISVTSAEAKGVITKPHQKHICYMLTPTRYLYSHKQEYLLSKAYLKFPIIKQIINYVFNYVKSWDRTAITRPDVIIPISNLVSKRIQKYYGLKPSKVIYPPVDIKLSKKEIDTTPLFKDTRRFLLSISRLVEYKRVDLSISACLKLKRSLVVVGEGEAKNKLHKIAGNEACIRSKNESLNNFLQRATKDNKKILFTGSLSQKSVNKLFKNCDAVLMPGQEDFGITALEAGIFGKPVIVFYTSGVAELLLDSKHAIHIRKETVPEMVYALGKLDTLEFDPLELRSNAMQHNVEKFKLELTNRIEKELKGEYVLS